MRATVISFGINIALVIVIVLVVLDIVVVEIVIAIVFEIVTVIVIAIVLVSVIVVVIRIVLVIAKRKSNRKSNRNGHRNRTRGGTFVLEHCALIGVAQLCLGLGHTCSEIHQLRPDFEQHLADFTKSVSSLTNLGSIRAKVVDSFFAECDQLWQTGLTHLLPFSAIQQIRTGFGQIRSGSAKIRAQFDQSGAAFYHLPIVLVWSCSASRLQTETFAARSSRNGDYRKTHAWSGLTYMCEHHDRRNVSGSCVAPDVFIGMLCAIVVVV